MLLEHYFSWLLIGLFLFLCLN